MKRNRIKMRLSNLFVKGTIAMLITSSIFTSTTFASEYLTDSVITQEDENTNEEIEIVPESKSIGEYPISNETTSDIEMAEEEQDTIKYAGEVEETAETESEIIEEAAEEIVGAMYDSSISSANFYVLDSRGEKVDSYKKGSTEYLFLPNSMNLNHVTVICKNAAKSVSRGTYNASDRTITIDASSNVTISITDTKNVTKKLVIMHSNLPSIQISLNGTDLNTIHSRSKDIKYAGNTVSITDPSNSANNLLKEDSVEIKGRGNTTWVGYGDKKPYQIKFSKKESVLGMTASKKWVLLANACDGSLLKNATVFNAVNQMGFEYSVKMQSVDLWIDGSYRGNYFLSEKVEFDKARLNLEKGSILSELDNVYYYAETNFIDALGQYMTLKDPDLEDKGVSEDWKTFQSKWNAFESALKKQNWQSWDQIETMIDVESFAKWYLVSEFFSNQETDSTSCYFYYNAADGKIYAGPLWDFDSSMNSCHYPTEKYYLAKKHAVYSKLLPYSAFAEEVVVQYNNYRSVLTNSANYMKNAANQSAASIEMNYIRWDTLDSYITKGITLEKTYDKNLNASVNWLNNRQTTFTPYIPVSGRGQIVCQNTYSDRSEMYRLYNTKSGEHLYTGDIHEANVLTVNGWKYEGIAWYAPKTSNTSVYRLYNTKSGEHLYTRDANEKNVLSKMASWNYEGIAWYSADANGGVPVYRLYNARAKSFGHHYTKDSNERRVLIAQNWRDESIGWYGLS